MKYFAVQHESEQEFNHIQSFAKIKYGMYFGNVRNLIGISYVKSVGAVEKIKAIEYCQKKKTEYLELMESFLKLLIREMRKKLQMP